MYKNNKGKFKKERKGKRKGEEWSGIEERRGDERKEKERKSKHVIWLIEFTAVG